MIHRLIWLAWFWAIALCHSSLRAEIPLDRIEPAECLALIRFDNFAEFHRQLAASDFGQLWSSAAMSPFREKLPKSARGLADRWLDRIGFTESQWIRLARGPLAVLITSRTVGHLRLTAVIETDVNSERASLLQSVTDNLRSRGWKDLTREFPIPASILSASDRNASLVFASTENFTIISDDFETASFVAQRVTTSAQSQTVSGSKVGQLHARVSKSNKLGVQWTFDPQQLLNSVDSKQAKPSSAKRLNSAQKWLRDGLGGVTVVTGSLVLEARQLYGDVTFESDQAPDGLLKLLDVPPGQVQFPTFIPREASRVAVAHWNIAHAIERFGAIYDDLTEAPGAFSQTLADTKSELNVDLHGELFPMLGPLVCTLGRYDAATKSEQSLVVFDIKSPATQAPRAADMVHRLFVDDTETKQTKIPGQQHSLWEVSFAVGDENTSFANAGLMVAQDKLWCATHANLIKDILQRSGEPGIHTTEDFRQACSTKLPFASSAAVLRSFTRIDRELEFTFNTLKTKGTSGLRNPGSAVAMLFATLLGATAPKHDVDFSVLPEYSQISKYLGYTTWSIEHGQDQWRVHYRIFPKDSSVNR